MAAKPEIFRPVEFWRAAMTALPNASFFDLARSALGKVKTPFSKQALMGDLEKFFSSPQAQRNTAGFVDDRDASAIAAIAFLGEPREAELAAFFSGEFGAAELGDLLVNLEERFIVYRFISAGEGSRLALNPLLRPAIEAFADDASRLFPSFAAPDGDAPCAQGPLFYDDRLLAALISFASHCGPFFRLGGDGVRQRTMRAAKAIFPGRDPGELFGAARALGLLVPGEGDALVKDARRVAAFARLGARERAQYFAAGLLCHRDLAASPQAQAEDPSPWLLRSKIRACASFAHGLCALVEEGRLYPFATLQKLAFAIAGTGGEFKRAGMLRAMIDSGLIVPAGSSGSPGIEGLWRRRAFDDASSAAGKAVIAMDAPFGVVAYPEAEFGDAAGIAVFAQVAEAGLNFRFEISRDSAAAAYTQGLKARDIIDLLQGLSGGLVDETLAFALRDWEKSHGEVALRRGLVLTLAPDRRYLAETKPLSAMLLETVAPGVYMLDERFEERAEAALRKAGVGIIARAVRAGDSSSAMASPSAPSPSATTLGDSGLYPRPRPADFVIPRSKGKPAPEDEGRDARELVEGLKAALGRMSLDKEQRDELSERIDRRLILLESQLEGAALRYEKTEARGMDYAGKTLIARQSISMKSLVEVVWTVKDREERAVGVPRAIEKSGGDSALVFDVEGEAEPTRVPMGKIGLLRRIKRSIFETANE
ncbi:MAG: helicase-associated domain-containing protein [Treponema sp.]|nr:helicase-associated domain-containing protein [Treponema sp.]